MDSNLQLYCVGAHFVWTVIHDLNVQLTVTLS